MQLAKDLEQLRTFYYNNGYLKFQVVDQKVTVSPDNKSVDILIVVSEGGVYRLKGYEIKGLSDRPADGQLHKYIDPP